MTVEDVTTAFRRRRRHKAGYIPGLDGWRALAIFMVLMDHDDPWQLFGHSNVTWHEYGGWGVWLFFAISGYLVCSRILADEAAHGRFRIGDFYLRRLFRIQPAALVYLAAITGLCVFHVAHESVASLLGALFLYQNYLFHHADVSGRWFLTGHFWTLAVEEHFYLLLSLLLLLFRRHRVAVFASAIGVLLVWQKIGHRFVPYDGYDNMRYSEFNLQYLLLAAMFALLLRQASIRSGATRFLQPWVAFAVTALGLIIFTAHHSAGHSALQEGLLTHAHIWFYTFPLWVVATSLHPESWTTRCLELRPLKFLGRLSYSIYLWHALFFLGGRAAVNIHAHWLLLLCARPWRYVATALAACASFYCVERPLQRLGHQLAPPASPGHSDLRERQADGSYSEHGHRTT